jgi:hypothetical protein
VVVVAPGVRRWFSGLDVCDEDRASVRRHVRPEIDFGWVSAGTLSQSGLVSSFLHALGMKIDAQTARRYIYDFTFLSRKARSLEAA